MTTKELKDKIGKVLGNSIRCLLPSYWWKTLFNDVADTIEDVKKEAEDMVVKSFEKFNDEHPAIADNTFYMTLDKTSEEAQHNVAVMTRLMYNALIKLQFGQKFPEVGPLYIAVAAYDNESTEEKVYVIHSAQYGWAISQIVFFNVPIYENSVLETGTYTVAVRPDGTTVYERTGNIGVSGGSSITVDSSMSSTSTNPVQNKVVKAYVDSKTTDITDLKGLTFTVAFDAQLNDTTTDEEKAANKSNLITYLQDVQTDKNYQIYLNAYLRDSNSQYRIKVNPSYIGPAMFYSRAYSGNKMIFAKLDLGDVLAGLNYDLILDKNDGFELVPHIDAFETNMLFATLTSDNKVTTNGLVGTLGLRQNQEIYKHIMSDNMRAPITLYLTEAYKWQLIPARVEKSSDMLYVYAGDYSLSLNSDGTVTEL